MSGWAPDPLEMARIRAQEDKEMLNRYELEVRARCPKNPAVVDVYDFVIEARRVIEVEDLWMFFSPFLETAAFQEDITAACARKFGARVVSVGVHSGVKTTCTA